MLERLNLRGTAAFADGVELGPFKPITLIFGPNGSGKTTISRVLADPDRFAGTTLEWQSASAARGLRVYNRDYVEATLKQAKALPGVFLLGQLSAELQIEIQELDGPDGRVAKARAAFDKCSVALAKKHEELAATRRALEIAVWDKRDEVPKALHDMFKGVNGAKSSFATKLLSVEPSDDASNMTFEALLTGAEPLLSDVQSEAPSFESHPTIAPSFTESLALLNEPIIGSDDVRLAPLIAKLDNADWVQQGTKYLDDESDDCPFCQQRIPHDLQELLGQYFDERYLEEMSQVRKLKSAVDDWIAEWQTWLVAVEANASFAGHLDANEFKLVRKELEDELSALITPIGSKLENPSGIYSAELPDLGSSRVVDLIERADESVAEFNRLLKNRATERANLFNRAWEIFASNATAPDLAVFRNEQRKLEAAIRSMADQETTAEKDWRGLKDRLRELQSQVTSSRPIIDRINRLLTSVGFHSFRLQESASLADGYALVRESGEVDTSTLSEGERTFLTFLYYAQALEGTPPADDQDSDLVAVVDDPISSLDSDVAYAVSTIMHRIMNQIEQSEGRVRQVILLTHNTHFYKEVSYERPGTKGKARIYGLIRKRPGAASEVTFSAKSPVQTAYGALWDEAIRISSEPAASPIALQNVLRRILETYFKVLGGVDDPKIINAFEDEDKLICRSLFSWVNAGSHAIFDDIEHSFTSVSSAAYMDVFRRIFEEHQQLGHYKMMMGELEAQS